MTHAKTVLVPLDGSVHATAAVPVARGLAELFHATLAVLHVTDDALASAALAERMKLSGEDMRGLVVEQRRGSAAAVIVQEAAERNAAMIVMCPQIRTDVRPRAFGSVAAAVLRAAPCPVVLVPPARGRKRWALRRLLVPHDGTPTSAATIGPATDFASIAAAELVVLHVVTPGTERPIERGTLVSPRYVDQPQHEWPVWAQEFLDRLRAVGGARDGIDTRLAVAQGEAGSAIVNFAQENDSDLIVLGWRGVLEPDRARTMRRVIRDSNCPVVVVRVRSVEPAKVTIDVARFETFLFDLDGVITQTASIHARAWKQLFDEFLARRVAATGAALTPFDVETDYRRYVDGKPRMAGLLSFLAARGLDVPVGEPEDQAEQETAHGLASRKDRYFVELLAREGVRVFDPAVALLREARGRGVRLAVASSSHHCAEILRAGRLTGLFDARVDGIDIDRLGLSGKPAPDMFLEAARRLGVFPARAVVFEDATSGVAAARAGGFGLVVGVGPSTHAAALLESGADHVVSDLSEVRLQGYRAAASKTH